MKIKTITYRRTKNIGNGESITAEVTAELEKDEFIFDVINSLHIRLRDILEIISDDKH